MTTEVLNQLRSLRESIADTLRKDPRYLTLASLDKSIAEISGVMKAAGLDVPVSAKPAPLQFEGGATPAGNGAEPHGGDVDPVPFRKGRRKPNLDEVGGPASIENDDEGIAARDEAAPATQVEAHHDIGLTPRAAAPEPSAALPLADLSDAADEPTPEHDAETSDEAVPFDTGRHADEHSVDAPASHDAPYDAALPQAPADHAPADSFGADHIESGALDAGHSDASGLDAEHADAAHAEAAQSGAAQAGADEPDATPLHAAAVEPADAEAPHVATEPVDAEPSAAEHMGGAAIPDGKTSGYTPMAAKPGAAQYQPAMSVKFGKLPNKVDLRPLMTPIEDQGETSSCVANAVAGAYEYWIRKASKQQHDISRLFVYYNARWRDGSQDTDDGSVIQLAMEGLAKFGACSDAAWPFDAQLVTQKPGADAYKDAAPFKVHDMAQVPVRLESWKQALAEGKPIVFGCLLFESFDDCTRHGGVVPMPAPDALPHAAHGGHAMCAVGYSDSEKVFIVRNSWGPDWGDAGYCYMPYAYLMSEKFNDGDCWVFVPKVPSQPPREVWSDDSGPVTNGGHGVDFPIEPHSVDEYRQVPVDFFDTIRKPFNGTAPADYASYVALASKAQWTDMEAFDYRSIVGSSATLAGTAAVAAALSGFGDDGLFGADEDLEARAENGGRA